MGRVGPRSDVFALGGSVTGGQTWAENSAGCGATHTGIASVTMVKQNTTNFKFFLNLTLKLRILVG